eukprot:XP_025004491.1 deubiquitinase DESI2 isoform X10 [Gallus gallus]
MCYVTIASAMEGADQLFLNEHQLILWIYDPESADASELNHTAVFLSESSQILSKLLWIWGQKPVGQTYFKLKTFHSERFLKLRSLTFLLAALQEGTLLLRYQMFLQLSFIPSSHSASCWPAPPSATDTASLGSLKHWVDSHRTQTRPEGQYLTGKLTM